MGNIIKINQLVIDSVNFQLDNSRYYVDIRIIWYMMYVFSRKVGADNWLPSTSS